MGGWYAAVWRTVTDDFWMAGVALLLGGPYN